MLPKGKFKSIVARRVKPETVDQQGPGIPQSKLNMNKLVIFNFSLNARVSKKRLCDHLGAGMVLLNRGKLN